MAVINQFLRKSGQCIPLYEEESKGSVSIKLDGVNTSFRLQKANNPAGFMFVIDKAERLNVQNMILKA